MRNRPSIYASLAAVCLLVLSVTAARAESLVFGVYPDLSAAQLASQYFPLRDLVSRTLGQPVTLLSAPDERSFAERTQRGDFDLVLTAPHMARRAELRDGWQRVAQTGYQLEVVVLARAGSELRQLADLRGQTLAIGPRASLTYRVVAAALEQQGLNLDRDVKPVPAPFFNDVMYALMRGQAEAGATSKRQWHQATASQRAAVREIHTAPPVPGYFVMANPRLGKAALQSLRQAFQKFHESRDGQLYFRKTEQIDFRPIDDETMQRQDAFAAEVEAAR